jgi:ATP-dependent DNA helicase RecQ
LLELSTYLPNSKEELNQISGFGAFKIEKYGKLFLPAILNYCNIHNLTSKISEKKPKKQRESKRVSKSTSGTFATTFELFKAGNNFEEIAKIRNLSINTIQNHLANFVATGKIEANELMDMNKIEPIIQIAKSQTIQSLKAIKDELGDGFSYFEINIAIAYHQSQQ